jgi:6-phosphogluconolactonase (cycloisomerase 2 family)
MVFGGQTVQGFSVDENTGATAPLVQGPLTVGDGFTRFVATDPQGKFLYIAAEANRTRGGVSGHDEIGAFRINSSNGDLTPVAGSPYIMSEGTGAIAVSPDSKFLYMAQLTGISVFSIDQNSGALTLLPGSPFAPPDSLTANARIALAIDPSGRFLYEPQEGLARGQGGQIAVYSLSTSTGTPTPVTGSPFHIASSISPTAIVADPQGRFVFTGGEAGGLNPGPNVDVQQVHTPGSLSPAPGSPFASNDPVFSMTIEPSGKFLYVAAGGVGPSGVFAYTIDPSSGALMQVLGSPFAPNKFGPMATDHSGKFLYIGTSSGLLSYAIDPVTGALIFVSGDSSMDGSLQSAVTTVAY